MRFQLWIRVGIRECGRVASAALFAAVALAASDARAQASGEGESRASTAQRKRPIGLEELTVTARKREERLHELPFAASAIAGSELKDLDVRTLQDLDGLAPNLTVTGSAGAPRVYVRGVGNGDALASDAPGVGLYLDGVFLTRAQGGLFTISDIERVEVLRGPQGTLFGRNTLGGAVNVVTRKPALDELGSRAEVRAGSHERLDTRLSVNVPLIAERAAARVSLAMTTRDGFQKSERSGRGLDDDRLFGVRTQLLAAPSEDLELVLALDGSRQTRRSDGYKCKLAGRSGVRPAGSAALLEACAEDEARGTRRIAAALRGPREELETYGASLTASWTLRDSLTLTSISAGRHHELEAARDADATLFPSVGLDLGSAGGEEQAQFSQELQLAGQALGGRLSYVTGLFWLAERARGDARLEVDGDSYAAYGQATYALTDRLSWTLGARLGAERKRIDHDGIDHDGGGATTHARDLAPMAAFRYALSDDAHVYGTWSRGFKAGGFSFDGRADPSDEEELTSYEIGLKSLFLDSRLRLNAAVFYELHEDIQLGAPRSSPTPGRLETRVTNAGGAEIRGAELEMRAVPYPGFELASALGVARAEDRGSVGTPTYTLSFGASYQLPLGALGDLRLRADWTHLGRSGTHVVGSRLLRQGKHGELDGQLAWALADGLTEVVLLGSNLFDREYVVDGIDLEASFGSAYLRYNRPRTYGVEIRRSF